MFCVKHAVLGGLPENLPSDIAFIAESSLKVLKNPNRVFRWGGGLLFAIKPEQRITTRVTGMNSARGMIR